MKSTINLKGIKKASCIPVRVLAKINKGLNILRKVLIYRRISLPFYLETKQVHSTALSEEHTEQH